MYSIIFALAALSAAPLQTVGRAQAPAPPAPPAPVTLVAPAPPAPPAPVTFMAPAPPAPAALDFSSVARVVNAWLPPKGWAPQDPADSLWRAARSALDNGDPRRAAELYHRLRTDRRFRSSEYRSHAFYWEAYARQRIGGVAELRSGMNALRELRRSYPQFENMVEVERLESRLNAELAAAGDADAASRLARQASQAGRAPRQNGQCADQELRVTVVESLITMSSEQAMPLLKKVMAGKDECNALLREKAVFIISQKKSAEAEDLLLDAARNDPSSEVREQAVFWLSQVNTEKALAAIEEVIRTATDPELLEQAVFAASQHPSPRSAQILRDIATRGNAPQEARKNAIFWLGQSRGADVNRFMRGLYSSLEDTELKEAVLFALSQNRDAANADFLLEIAMNEREPMAMRKSALFWAGQQRALPLDRLGELYRSMPDREMRESIIFTISQRNESEAIERLIDIARNERDIELRKTAIFWLGQSKDPRAVAFLGELIGG